VLLRKKKLLIWQFKNWGNLWPTLLVCNRVLFYSETMNSQLGWKVAINVSGKSQNGPFLGCFAAFKWACAGQLKPGSALSVRCISCVHHRGGIQRISGAVHHKRAHSMQQFISQCISIRPARIGSLAPPNCWRATHGQKFLPPPAPKSFDTCAFFKLEKWGDCSREQFRHVAALLGIAVFCYTRECDSF